MILSVIQAIPSGPYAHSFHQFARTMRRRSGSGMDIVMGSKGTLVVSAGRSTGTRYPAPEATTQACRPFGIALTKLAAESDGNPSRKTPTQRGLPAMENL